jgi:hypothetical protein
MTTLALYLLNFNFLFHMVEQVGYIDVTACTGIFAMHRTGKRLHRDPVTMTTKTGRRVYSHTLLGTN